MYNFQEVEEWAQKQFAHQVSVDTNRPKYYVLEMFPYPSGNIHMGHLRNYTIGDVIARYKRARGYNVLHPIGWDAFGLPAENAALQHGLHPGQWTTENISTMKKQLQAIGLSYDWTREVTTCDPDYYRHEQKFFLEFLENGLAYRKESFVNWDPVDNTVLANEQVIDGKGWRSGAPIERKKLAQWFLKITDFAPELLQELDSLHDWPEKVRTMQDNWIGKSEGAIIEFAVIGTDEKLSVFTTRPETIFGAAFCAIAMDHPLVQTAMNDNISQFIQNNPANTTAEIETAEKKGIDTGLRVQHPFIPDRTLPIYIANFVLMEYGTGAVFACPAHDQRDYDFAKKYNLHIYPVITDSEKNNEDGCYTIQEGTLYNSEFLNGLDIHAARKLIIEKLIDKKIGKRVINYRLRDWGISRQRYWGCPIPIIHCPTCGIVPVPFDELPVTLPKDVDFTVGGNPLEHHKTWKHVKCPRCQSDATRETDTFDTFFESSWYFIAFCGLDKLSTDYFLPVDCYIGGVEHAVLHLLYARFFTKALKKCGYVNISEPFKKLITQGMICHKTYQDQDGNFISPEDAKTIESSGQTVTIGRMEKMSKSKKNVINPSAIIDKYGADTARIFMLSDIPPERDLEWSEHGVEGAWRFLNRVYRLLEQPQNTIQPQLSSRRALHKVLQALTEDLEACRLNCAIAKLHEMTNIIYNDTALLKEGLPILIRCLEPFAPHLAEYLWTKSDQDGSAYDNSWPQPLADMLIDDTVTIAVQVNGKLRNTIEVSIQITRQELENIALQAVKERVNPENIKKIIVVPKKIVNIVQ